MGVDYYAYAVIGCEVTGKLYDEVEVANCNCSPPLGARFCPECGRPTGTKMTKTSKPFYDVDRGLVTNAFGGSLRVRFTTDDKRAFCGISTNAVNDLVEATQIAFVTGTFGQAVMDAVKNVLNPLGLWDPDTFGVWAVMYCSY